MPPRRGSPTRPLPGGTSRLLATWGLMIATAMQAADASIANVALPRIERDLGGGLELGAWIMTSYLCAAAIAAPLTAWLRRRVGGSALFPASVAAFAGASALCALAPGGGALIAFRIAQGAAGGVILPLAQAVLLDSYPKERHARMLAIWGAALMVGPIIGPAVGGVITDLTSWRGVFAINLPLGALIVVLMRGLRTSEEAGRDQAIDPLGLVLLMAGIGALELCLERGVGRSWLHSPELLTEGSVMIAAFAGLAMRAKHSGFSVFKPDIFKDVNFAVAAFYNFMTSALLFVAVVFIPALVEGSLGYSATMAGFTIVPRAVLMMLMMLWVGRLIGTIDYRVLLAAGWLLMAGGLAILSLLPARDQLPWILLGTTVQAVGAGMLFTPHSTLAYSTLSAELRTDAAGLYSLLRQLGFASGVALMTAVFRTLLAAKLARSANGAAPVLATLANAASFQAYCQCFRFMAIASVALLPGVLLFRFNSPGAAAKQAA